MERLKRPETIVLVVTYLVLIAANMLGEIFRFGGVTSADVSNEIFAWFTPAGYVFSIWSVIYIGLAIWIARLVMDDRREREFAGLPVGIETILFVASSGLNIAWLALWHLKVFAVTIPVIMALLATVAALYMATRRRSDSLIDRTPIAIYASWLTVATVANIAHVITRATAADAGLIPAISTLVLLLMLAAAALVMRKAFDEYAFGLVVAWAGIGIGVRLTPVSPVIGVTAILVSTIGIAAILLPWNRLKPALDRLP